MRDEMRLKLDRRIHNQRVALRDNWEVVERRQRSNRNWYFTLFKDVSKFLDDLGVPRGAVDGGTYAIGYRMKLARAHLAKDKTDDR